MHPVEEGPQCILAEGLRDLSSCLQMTSPHPLRHQTTPPSGVEVKNGRTSTCVPSECHHGTGTPVTVIINLGGGLQRGKACAGKKKKMGRKKKKF